jgi:phytoene dehydrogenase-like protein
LPLLPRFGGTESQGGGGRDVVGGAAVTEESHPGFRNSVAAYTASLLNPKVIADMNLSVHGLTVVERRASNFLL